jgi:hypothetical protein
MQAIRKVHDQSESIALDCLEHFVSKRLVPEAANRTEHDTTTQDWIERACVAFILYATQDTAFMTNDITTRIQTILNHIGHRADISFTPRATHAAQTLIWKAMSRASPEVADAMCDVLRNRVFDSAGSINKARIGR